MKSSNDYRIAFVGLKVGVNYFNFEIDDDFFLDFEDSPVSKGKLFIDVALEKGERVFTLTFDVGGQVKVDCDRCAEGIDLPLTGHYKVFVRTIGRDFDNQNEEEEDVIVISPVEAYLELHRHIYEFILLSLPLKRNCEGGPYEGKFCNQDILSKLQQNQTDEPTKEATDPRWDKLKSIKNK